MRENPVAMAKIAVLTPSRRRGGGGGVLRSRRRPRGRYSTGASAATPSRFSAVMANIHSQKKRILRAERERLENRRYTSKVKTLFRRLETAVAGRR